MLVLLYISVAVLCISLKRWTVVWTGESGTVGWGLLCGQRAGF